MKEAERIELIKKLKEQREAVGKIDDLTPEEMPQNAEILSVLIDTDYECRHDVGVKAAGNYCTCLDCGNLISEGATGKVYKSKESAEKIRNLYLRCLLCTDPDTAVDTVSNVYEMKLVKPNGK